MSDGQKNRMQWHLRRIYQQSVVACIGTRKLKRRLEVLGLRDDSLNITRAFDSDDMVGLTRFGPKTKRW